MTDINRMIKRLFKSLFSFCRTNLSWTGLGVVITGLALWVGVVQLRASNKINSETFLHNLKTDFFTKETRDLIFLIEIDALKFDSIRNNAEKDTMVMPFFQ